MVRLSSSDFIGSEAVISLDQRGNMFCAESRITISIKDVGEVYTQGNVLNNLFIAPAKDLQVRAIVDSYFSDWIILRIKRGDMVSISVCPPKQMWLRTINSIFQPNKNLIISVVGRKNIIENSE